MGLTYKGEKMKWLLAVLFIPVMAHAQAAPGAPAPDPCNASLSSWVQCQQGQSGLAYQVVNSKWRQTYATTWWDMVSFGQAGINIGAANAHDYIDLGPTVNAGNALVTRYGLSIPIHIGNIWNDSSKHLPASIASRVRLASIPNMTIAPQFFWPQDGNMSDWTFLKDFMLSIAYRYGGSM